MVPVLATASFAEPCETLSKMPSTRGTAVPLTCSVRTSKGMASITPFLTNARCPLKRRTNAPTGFVLEQRDLFSVESARPVETRESVQARE